MACSNPGPCRRHGRVKGGKMGRCSHGWWFMCGFSPGVRGSLMAEIYVKILQHLACILSYLFVLRWLPFKGMFKGLTVGMFVSKTFICPCYWEAGQPPLQLDFRISRSRQLGAIAPRKASPIFVEIDPRFVCFFSDEIKTLLVDDWVSTHLKNMLEIFPNFWDEKWKHIWVSTT